MIPKTLYYMYIPGWSKDGITAADIYIEPASSIGGKDPYGRASLCLASAGFYTLDYLATAIIQYIDEVPDNKDKIMIEIAPNDDEFLAKIAFESINNWTYYDEDKA